MTRSTTQTKHSTTVNQLPCRMFTLDVRVAANWVVQLNSWISRQTDDSLQSFRNQLEDAAWLARWKRETARIELSMHAIPEIIEALTVAVENDSSAEAASLAESMITNITKSNLSGS